ncbi:MAG: tripartite tricarboxylate transporter permease [Halobacteriales archaeon]
MEIAGIRVVAAPEATLAFLGFVCAGAALGTASGLVPGLHANNFALLLAAVAPSVPGPPVLVGAAMLAAGVVHTFLDVVPALALGVPDPAMAATALPGHRLVIEGRGREALRLSALGSGLAVVLAVPLALPVTAAMARLYPLFRPHLSVLLTALAVFLVASEPTLRARAAGAATFLATTGLGLATLDIDPAAPVDAGGMLAPLFAGLFGAPVLIDAARGAGVPRQADATVAVSRRALLVTALAGTLAGAAVGYLPAVTSAIAAVVVLATLPAAEGARGFVVATSGVNTANTVFALFALLALGTPRTGVLVALTEANVPLNLPLFLLAVACAGAVGFLLVPWLGDRYLRAIRRVSYTRLSLAVLCGLAGLSALFGGAVGVLAFLASAGLGLVPPRTGARRVHCMGVLMGPLALQM